MDKDIGGAQGELGGNDIHLGASGASYQSYAIFHELGHNLYLSHGGNPDESGIRNCEPNYISSMNYRYGYISGLGVAGLLDFSPARLTSGARVRAPLPDLYENAIDETTPLDATDTELFASYAGPPEKSASPSAAHRFRRRRLTRFATPPSPSTSRRSRGHRRFRRMPWRRSTRPSSTRRHRLSPSG